MTQHRNSLSDPEYARVVWARFRRMMWWMALAAVVSIALALLYLWLTVGSMPLSMLIATIAGVGLSVLLGTGLMGLVFLSSGTGHDEDVGNTRDQHDK